MYVKPDVLCRTAAPEFLLCFCLRDCNRFVPEQDTQELLAVFSLSEYFPENKVIRDGQLFVGDVVVVRTDYRDVDFVFHCVSFISGGGMKWQKKPRQTDFWCGNVCWLLRQG